MMEAPVVKAEENQRDLVGALAAVRAALERHADGTPAGAAPTRAPAPGLALAEVTRAYGLTPFERDVLLLAAGPELDASFGPLCARAQGDPRAAYPTFGLALAAFPGAHWSAIAPTGPLRWWRLVDVPDDGPLASAPLRVDEYVLHYLAGVPTSDPRLAGLVDGVPAPADLAPSEAAAAERLARVWRAAPAARDLPVLEVVGPDAAARRAVAAAACRSLGLMLAAIPADLVPSAPAELDALLRAWGRHAILSGSALLVEFDDDAPAEPGRLAPALRLAERLGHPTLLSARERRPLRRRAVAAVDVPRPARAEQAARWRAALGSAGDALDGFLDSIATEFRLSHSAVRAAAAEALASAPEGAPAEALAREVWRASRSQARPRLDDLAQRVEPVATWDDLVLPEHPRATLREIAAHVRHRPRVHDAWGFASKSRRGLGVSVLFAGDSGTGKTMAAEVLANELDLDLHRVDLSQVVSKYIGETEKNLRRVFDAADEGGSILLFDEADALFGKRSEVRDSHDRYANIEVSYLLQRMEEHRGLAILTTNLRDALDAAFMRRLRFVVDFPFPDAGWRAEIWRRAFPRETPTEGLDHRRLAQLHVPGGNIRNIALAAAFLAADAGGPVRMAHVLRAARGEYAKLGRTPGDHELRGWA